MISTYTLQLKTYNLLWRILHFLVLHQLLVAQDFLPIFFVDVQHAETFTIMLSQMLMVHLVRPTNGTHIGIVAS